MTVHALDRRTPDNYSTAVEAYLRSAGIAASSKRVYRISLLTWAWLVAGQQPPLAMIINRSSGSPGVHNADGQVRLHGLPDLQPVA